MLRAFCFALSFVAAVHGSVASAADPAPAWPQANGPYGNYTPRQYGVKLLDDAAGARQVWLSEDNDLGYAKGSASGYVSNLARWDGHPGSSSGPILAEGKLFVTTFRPSGEAWAEGLPHLKSFLDDQAKPLSDEQKARLWQNLRILADDLTVAIDQKTGKTVWKAVEAGKGLNRYMGKRQGFCVSPAYHNRMVFSMGTTGLLYAYSATNGEKLWETNIGPAHQAALEHKAKVLQQKTLPGGMGWDVSLTVAGGVLVVPLFDGADVSLRGVDVKTGATLWEVARACSRHATPAVWTHQDKQYVLTATVSGKLHLIDPQSGKVLWTVSGLGPNHFSMTPTEQYVFVNAGSGTPRKEGDDQRYGLLAAYKLTSQAATLAWKHPEQPDLFFPTWMDSCARRFLAVRDGRVYYRAHGKDKAEKRLLMLDEATGEALAAMTLNSPALQYYPVEDRLLAIRDASHSQTELAFITTDPKNFRQLAEFWHPPHQQTTAYEVYMEHPYADGHVYLRTKDGRIACYDLRQPN
jgi:outer membrane protein assembly factor BamB